MNQADVSNTNTIFTPPSTPLNLEEDQPEQDLIKPLKTVYSRKFRFCKSFEAAAKTATTNTTTTTSI